MMQQIKISRLTAIAGSADIELNGRCGDLSIQTSGMGDVDVYGKPAKVHKTINGLGSLDIKD